MSGTYKVIRFYEPDSQEKNKVMAMGLTLEEARAHCEDTDTHQTCGVGTVLGGHDFFDGYMVE